VRGRYYRLAFGELHVLEKHTRLLRLRSFYTFW
jgi:hypothetical protein